ncbi:hypothetical protein A9264_15280 [Vibrio sp. UCD-FRSSP16_10]|uniref:glycosyltransferase family 4 protein n=1 Tax=unclassified Vibrio TaxID=2614977 RepID=UPI0007FC33DC|nr:MULTISPECIES: glycosyltransferase family 4 protein [unclassified Vibrio]OBT13666.1 hypothetical protein A9260_13945 [Vibrio sp. UCD-FRSSP16_30]OBT19220.1 hypothetical protein A9264_15280 [Vibrio sp. UCD-FRSSP16_10]
MKKLLFAINVGWYYDLHWKSRIQSSMTEDFDVHLCMSKPTDLNQANVTNLSLTRSSVGLFDNIRTLYQAVKTFVKVKPDFIHSVTIKPNIMFGLIALFARVPIYLTIPGMGSMFSQNTSQSRLIAKVIIIIYRLIGNNKNSVFTFENNTDREYFITNKICSQYNSIVVPGSGVNVEEYDAPKIDVVDAPLKILFAARLLEGKGLRDLIQAVKNVQLSGYPVILNVAGIIDNDSNEAIPLAKLETWSQEGKINWLGQINDGMQKVIADNDVIALPTRYGEGLPRILIEANACRRPVITTDIGGCKDFVTNGLNGLVVPTSDIEELTQAIIKLSERDYCAMLGEKGRIHVVNAYTDKHVIDCYKRIYKLDRE